ncbi:MAG: glycoside hydrolase family 3 C-terminal domain-containing protein [Firmicutes bacterium]|nr:glycoside hydrolase family 3 C-terminal domain-containing protein [Bacillota bacterium]
MKKQYPGTTSLEVSQREKDSQKVARKAAAESMVLLKNNGILPLQEGSQIALYGGGASFTVKGGTGSGMVNNRTNVSITEGLKNAGIQLLNMDWLEAYDREYKDNWEAWKASLYAMSAPGDRMGLYRAHASNPLKMPDGSPITKKDTDTAVYVISRISGEGADRKAVKGDYYLSEAEEQQLKTVRELYEKVIVILNVGGIIDLGFVDQYQPDALVLMGQAGMEGGNALADVLLGRTGFSGRLTDSWAYRYEDYPSSANFSHNNGNIIEEHYTDSIYVGYKYFDTFGVEPRYPIGYGLSYSRFGVEASMPETRACQVIVPVRVTNEGAVPARQVVQLFAFLPSGHHAKELRRLAAFGKTGLIAPGEREEIELSFPIDLLASYWTARSQLYMDAGVYPLEIVSCDADGVMKKSIIGGLKLDEFTVIEKLSPICPQLETMKEISPDGPTALMAVPEEKLVSIDETVRAAISRRAKVHEMDKAFELPYKEKVEEILSKMTLDQKVKTVCGQPGALSQEVIGSAAITIPGAAGETTHVLKDLGVGHLIMADGPAGLRLQKHYQVNPADGSIYTMSWYESLENRFFGTEYLHEGAEDHYQFSSAIPVGTLLAQSYDTRLLEEVGGVIGTEMEELGVQIWLAPGMNIHRNPLCGRNFEYYSEDPLISGKMAAAITRGVEAHPGCIVTIKHYACNNQEENRFGVTSNVSERALRELYLKGFEIAVREAHPGAIMTSYNRLNSVHTANSYDLCTTVAREEWGFTGIIMTDWTTTGPNGGSSAAKCILAGNDLIMPGTSRDMKEIEAAVYEENDVSLPIIALDICVKRILSMTLRLLAEQKASKE